MVVSYLQQLTNLGLHLLGSMLAEDTGTKGSIPPIAWVIAAELSEQNWQHLGHVLRQV